ncbi:MAG: BatD family protein [Spirochaetes bacterium]|nr:BatD family protein [Spirochaetota bacterium]
MVNKIPLLILLIFFCHTIIFSDESNIKILTTKSKVQVDETFKIIIEVKGESGKINLETLPSIDNVLLKFGGQQISTSTVNFQTTTLVTFMFYAKINKAGQYEIGPFTLNIGNELFSVEPVSVNAIQSQEQTVAVEKEKSLYFLELEISDNEVYINEFIDITVYFYSLAQFQPLGYQSLKFPQKTWIEDIRSTKEFQGTVLRNNERYHQYEYEKKRIYIPESGEYTIPPFEFVINGLKLNDFSEFYPARMNLVTKEVNIIVKDLPEPPGDINFENAVGDFKVYTQMFPEKLKVDETATLQITLEGSGNFHTIEQISCTHDHSIEKYSVKSQLNNSNQQYKSKTWEYLLIPKKAGAFAITINDFTYFDPEKEKYITISGVEHHLEIVPAQQIKQKTVIVKPQNNDQKETIQQTQQESNDIHYIIPHLGKKNELFRYSIWSKVILFCYFLLFGLMVSYIIFKLATFIQGNNLELREQKGALQQFIKQTDLLRKKQKKSSLTTLIDEAANNLEFYLIKKLQLNSVNFTLNNMHGQLKNKISDPLIKELKAIITNLDLIRFSGLAVTDVKITDILNDMLKLVKQIDNEKKNGN